MTVTIMLDVDSPHTAGLETYLRALVGMDRPLLRVWRSRVRSITID